ncbi:unnamed protein product [Medioppia subpectinata]|uniref:Uncharacterized protein n=1 Tax=Medioppia subpectinata TaxID=1979941 RepID=A0A7R9KFY9_9ACAR|nr:unnamed protein product [Medioppia subpectinata]CAG2101864.1 unnamed protein product [Medioppia subpectinata]
MLMLIRESYGNEVESEVLFVETPDRQTTRLTIVDKQSHQWITWTSIKIFFASVFLPAGFPDSVSIDYIEYQIWDSIQAFASSIMNNLGTHAVLKGVGDSSATVLAATITWLLRDGTSMSGRILFAYIQSSKLDSDCKKWRLFADLINDLSILIDLLSPYFSQYFLYMQCFSGVLKSLVGTAGGATRAALTQHQSRRNNLADVSAKDGSQETLVNLTALICSLIIVPVVSTNTKAVKSVSLETFNLNRFARFVVHYLETNGSVLPVKTINRRENVWFFAKDEFDVYTDNIAIGVSLQTHLSNAKQLNELLVLYANKETDCQYILTYDKQNKFPINISLPKNFDSKNLLDSVFQAIVILFAHNMSETSDQTLQLISNEMKNDSKNTKRLLELSRKYTIDSMSELSVKATAEGWDMSKVLITPNEWRFETQ